MGTTNMEKMEEAENASKEIAKLTKEKNELEKKISAFKRKILGQRNRARTYVGMNTYGKILVRLGLSSEEKSLSTRSEFEKLQQKVLARIDELLKLEKNKNESANETTEEA